MKSPLFQSEKGFGLIDLLMALGALSISGLTMMALLTRNVQNSQAIGSRLGKTTLVQDIRSDLNRCMQVIGANTYQESENGRYNLTLALSNNVSISSQSSQATRRVYQLDTTAVYFQPNLATLRLLPDGHSEVVGDLQIESSGINMSSIGHAPIPVGRLVIKYLGTTITGCGLRAENMAQLCSVPANFLTSASTSCLSPVTGNPPEPVGSFVAEGTHYRCDLGPNETNHICVNSQWVNINYLKPVILPPVVIATNPVVTPPPSIGVPPIDPVASLPSGPGVSVNNSCTGSGNYDGCLNDNVGNNSGDSGNNNGGDAGN